MDAECMKNKLKQFRVRAGMTQAKLARKVGVTQPNYQRWESGSAPIPEEKLKKLAKAIETSPEALLGRHPPIEARFYDNSAGEDLNYYGEVAIHFCGGGAPLLLSISEEAFSSLHHDLQLNSAFVTVKSLANQTVAIRTKAIGDLYFSSEAYDTYGPEHDTYTDHASLQMPDPRDWEIVEALQHESGPEDFDPADVQRVQRAIMITDEQYAQLVADGDIKPEDLENERKKNEAETDRIFKLASITTYQLSTGQQRDVYVDSDENLYNAFYQLVEFEEGEPADDMILLQAEGSHRIAFVNKGALDYVSIPTHKYEAGSIEASAALLEDMEAYRPPTEPDGRQAGRKRG
jgi:transcriptional regulator with XRE-family HTH domain